MNLLKMAVKSVVECHNMLWGPQRKLCIRELRRTCRVDQYILTFRDTFCKARFDENGELCNDLEDQLRVVWCNIKLAKVIAAVSEWIWF